MAAESVICGAILFRIIHRKTLPTDKVKPDRSDFEIWRCLSVFLLTECTYKKYAWYALPIQARDTVLLNTIWTAE